MPPNIRGVARQPHNVDVLVNKQVRLPSGFAPRELAVPRVPFVFDVLHEKRHLRADAATALEALFAAAERDGAPLAAVSGYRSEATQRELFAFYVGQRGAEAAARISAQPGRSEHQTGLAIDVTGADGRCAAMPCFAGTPAARWLEANAPGHGFVIRYPDGAEAVTGYAYEPWHLRYLGAALARAVTDAGVAYDAFCAARAT